MITVLSRIFHYGFVNFGRNALLSLATVAVMVLALLVFLSLMIFNVVTDEAVSLVQDKIDISVYFKTTAQEDQILAIKRNIETLSEVKNVDYISRDRALEIFKESHKDDATIASAISELNNNPLQASLNVKAHDPNDYGKIAGYFTGANVAENVDSISYSRNQVVIDRLNAIIRNVNRSGFGLTLALTLLAGLVIFNTIWLAIYSNREEIGIMRVVGASNSLVRGPYVIEGIISGVLAAVLSVIIAAPVIFYISPYVKEFIPGFNVFMYFYQNILHLFMYQVLFGVLMGSVSSFIAVRRYLKN